MFHDGGINAEASHQQKVMPRFGCCFRLSLTCLLALLGRYMIILGCARKRQSLHLDMSNIYLVNFAVAERKGRFHRVIGDANFSRPDIDSTAGNDADDAATSFGIHYTVEDLAQRSI